MYRAYIIRDGAEYEVTAELYDHGVTERDSWQDTGTVFEIMQDPVFYKFECNDEDGNPVILTAQEIETAINQMIAQYWE